MASPTNIPTEKLPNSEFFMEATILNPPIVIDGKTYTLGFKCKPNKRARPHSRGQHTVYSITDQGDGTKRIVWNRKFQQCSVTENVGGRNQLRIYNVLTGGHSAPTPEPGRVYDRANAGISAAGCDAADKPDRNTCIKDPFGRLFRLISSHAFADDGDGSVSWQGSDPEVPQFQFVVDTSDLLLESPDLSINPGASIQHNPADDTFLSVGCLVENTATQVQTAITEQVFDGEDGYYPPDASFTGQRYFVDDRSGRFIPSTACESLGNKILVSYFWRDLTFVQSTGVEVFTIEGNGSTTGYGSLADDVCVVGKGVVYGAFGITIAKTDAGQWGSGAVECRITSQGESQMVAVLWDGTGITAIEHRDGFGIAKTSVSFATPPADLLDGDNFVIGLTRLDTSPSDIVISVTPEGGSPTTLATVTLTDLAQNQNMILGVAQWGSGQALVIGLPIGQNQKLIADGQLGQLRIQTFDNVVYRDLRGRGSSNTLDEITNLTTGLTMSQSATPARDHYYLDGTDIGFYGESGGDLIDVKFDPNVSAATPPGRAPRMQGTKNAATQDSTDIAENEAHKHDVSIVEDPLDLLSIEAGDTVECVDYIVWKSSTPPAVYLSVRNNPSFREWQLVDAAEVYGLWENGIFLVSKTVHDSLPVGGKICSVVRGTMIVKNGSFFADIINHAGRCIELFDEGWVPIGGIGGEGTAISAVVSNLTRTVESISCVPGGGPIIDSYMYGVPQGSFAQRFSVLSQFGINGFDYWDISPIANVPTFWVGFGDTSFRNDTFIDCSVSGYQLGAEGVYGGFVEVDPSGALASSVSVQNNFFGTQPDESPVDPDLIGGDWFTGFRLSAIGLETKGILATMAGLGAICVEAKMRVKVSGLLDRNYQVTVVQDYSRTPGDLSFNPEFCSVNIVVNGQTVRDYEYDDGVITKNISNSIQPVPNGTIGFQVLGRRQNSSGRVLIKRFGDYREVPADEYFSYGAGGISGGSVDAGKWSEVSATSLINQALKLAEANIQGLILWPSVAGVTPGSGVSSMAGYAQSLLPSRTVNSVIIDQPGYSAIRVTDTASAKFVTYDQLQIDSIVARFRMPSGNVTPFFPINRGPMMPQPAP